MLALRRLQVGEWLPDLPPYENPGALEVKNCIPALRSYRPLGSYQVQGDVVDASNPVVGATTVRRIDEATVSVFAGTATGLYRLQNDRTWTNVGGVYSNVQTWEFAQFGDVLIAVADGTATQVADISLASPTFSALTATSGTTPQAQRIAVVRDFVVLGDTDGGESVVEWSGYNNHLIWQDPTRRADSQTLYDGGKVQKIVGGRYGLIFQENKIRRMDFAGGRVIFSIQVVDKNRGTDAPNSVVNVGAETFWYAQDGFMKTDGRQVAPIGDQRVNQWFLDNASAADISDMVGGVDRRNRLIFWAFKSSPSVEAFDRLLIYNYEVNRWSYAEVSSRWLVESRSVGITLDGLDVPLPGGIDTDSIPMDSKAFAGGRYFLGVFGAGNDYGEFAGAALDAVVDTTELDGGGNRRMFINGLRPLIEGSESTVVAAQIGKRATFSETPSFDPTVPREANVVGEVPLRTDARYNRVRLTVSGGFDHIHGVDILGRPSGRF